MVADLMPLPEDLFRQVGILGDAVAAQQEGRFCVPVPQSLQQVPCISPGRTVIKGKGYIPGRLSRVGTDRQQEQTKNQCNNPPHGSTSLG